MHTIVDVAREAGVSIATVSRVVNQPDLVRKETLDKVHGAMARLNYNPNRQAHSLRSGSAKSLALLIGDISAPFYGTLARALSREGEARGYGLVLYDLENSTERLIGIMSRLHRSDTSCVVIALSARLQTQPVKDAITSAQARGLKVVTNSQIVDETIPAALPHFDRIAEDAVAYLDQNGAGFLALLGGSHTSRMMKLAHQGFEAACDRLGVEADNRVALEGRFKVEPTRDVVRDLLNSRSPETGKIGIICQTTRMATGALLAAIDAGWSVPDQLMILCCEELPQATEWSPELSTLAISVGELGTALFDLLLNETEGVPHRFLEHHMIERGTT